MNKSLPVGFSPASVTCFFSPSIGSTPANTYSKGCAINLDQGVSASVQSAPVTEVFFNAKRKSIAPVEYVIEKLSPEPVRISLESSLPLGCGFGLSASSCLATAFALVQQYNLNLSRMEIGMIAHEAEVTYKTGLGDVASQLCGGIAYRKCETGPLNSEQILLKSELIYFRIFDELDTSKVLSDPALVNKVAQKGAQAIQRLVNNMHKLTLADLLFCSYIFAKEAGLITNREVNKCINDVFTEGGQATMIMLGQGVLSTLPVGNTSTWTKCEIDKQGTRYIDKVNGNPH
jgi:pantoate kinase